MRAVVVTACTNRKRRAPALGLRARELPVGAVDEVARAWLARLGAADDRVPADRLYCGRAFTEAAAAARVARASLYIVSAGLGVIAADTVIPSYSLTVAPGSPDNVLARLQGAPPAATWWRAIEGRSPSALRFSGVLDRSPDALILLALPSAYLGMVVRHLLDLPEPTRAHLRLFSHVNGKRIDPRLRPFIMPYDGRLDDAESPIRGTRSDFSARALRHFVATVLAEQPDGSADDHRTAVEAALAGWAPPVAHHRSRLSDEQVLGLIRAHWDEAGGRSGRMLRLLRDRLSVACEQGRFRALFHAVRLEREARP